MPTQVKIWGCRGSVATPGPETVGHGGNTSCVEIALGDDAALVMDAGTGIRGLGFDLARRGTRRIDLFLTHLHLDHLEGLRFFAPLWNPEVTVDVWGPCSPVVSLRERILRAFSPPLFPLDFRDVPAEVRFHDLPGERWESHGISLTAELVLHPGPTLGYRVETGTSSLAYLPDHEPVLAGITDRSPDWISGGALAAGADVVLHAVPRRGVRGEDRMGALERRRRGRFQPGGRRGPPGALPPRAAAIGPRAGGGRGPRERAHGPRRSPTRRRTGGDGLRTGLTPG